MADPTPPRDGLGPLIDRMAALEARLRELEKPSGTQSAGSVARQQKVVDYLTTERLYSGLTFGHTIPAGTGVADGQWRWVSPLGLGGGPMTVTVPDGFGIYVKVTADSAKLTPGSGYAAAGVTFELTDAEGTVVPGYARGDHFGELYMNQPINAAIGTSDYPINTALAGLVNPFTLRVYAGLWVATANTAPASAAAIFNGLGFTLRIDGLDASLAAL